MVAYAHSLPNASPSEWETLEKHLDGVAGLAAAFADKFGAGDWGCVAGMLHDIGKLSPEFQARLHGSKASVDHSTAGARIAADRYETWGRLLAYVIAGHHAGLANWSGEVASYAPSPLARRLDTQMPIPATPGWEALCALPDALTRFVPTSRPDLRGASAREGLSLALFTRMVFSALVDADRLATEAFYRAAEGREPAPRQNWQPLGELKAKIDAHMADKTVLAAAGADADGQRRLQQERAEILAAARHAARRPPSLFSLTVPTGGGKTLASLTFALDHAVEHGLDRVIYVIPFTSIIEQTARVFRDALGPDLASHVLEHHSAFRVHEALAALETAAGGESGLQDGQRLRFATENWDAPLIVTTAVQFFESLFANRPSRCRKLHNIAKSVVILDEAQTLPLKLLRPTVAAIEELVLHYRSSAVLCTATQPALAAAQSDGEKGFNGGLGKLHEIIDQPEQLYERLARVTVRPNRLMTADALAAELGRLERVLCIVGTRAQARELFMAVAEGAADKPTFHLSALMCAAHRLAKLDEIKMALAAGACRVVATTVVEAGVDIDFPVVWRQMAGLDSIAQAAGRCNREGKLPRDDAIVQLFEVEGWQSIRELRANEAAAREVLRQHGDDPLGLAAIAAYFERLYEAKEQGRQDQLDARQILASLNAQAHVGGLPFADVARDYRLIESLMEPVIVPWDETARAAIALLGDSALPADGIRDAARRLQPYIVNVPRDPFRRLQQVGRIEPINPRRFDEQFMWLTREGKDNLYSSELGFDFSDTTFRSVENGLF